MQWIVITSPSFFEGEDRFISRLLAHGVDTIHLRKPDASESDCAGLLELLTDGERSRIVIHGFFELAEPYGLKGIHLNSRRNTVPEGYSGHISRSCHSLQEVIRYREECSYVFLSPIFDSVSKHGYSSAFTDETLRSASAEGVIDSRTVALGGVTPDRIDYLRDLGFGGAAMLGCVNSLACLPEEIQTARIEEIRKKFK